MPYHIRLMRPTDREAIEKLHAAQNERDGTNYPLTEVFDPRSWMQKKSVPLALTILDGEEIRQGVVFEATGVEMMLSGCDPKATAQLHREIRSAFGLLRALGFEVVNTLVPKDVMLPIEKPLRKVGFERIDPRMAVFSKDLTKLEDQET